MLLLDSGLRRAELAVSMLEGLDLRQRSLEVVGKGSRRAVRFRKARNHASQAHQEATMAWLQLAGPALDYFIYQEFLAGEREYPLARLPRIPIEYLSAALVALEPALHAEHREPTLAKIL